MGGSRRSPAKNNRFKLEVLYFLKPSALGSSFLIALNAVGALNKALTLYSSTTRQKAVASGVRTGLPSYNTVAHRYINGAYTI